MGIKDISTHFTIVGTIKERMISTKDIIDQHQLQGAYKIDCSCGKSYTGEIRRSLQRRLKEHNADIKNERSHTSTPVEYSLKTKHHVCLENAKIITREAIKREKS